MNCVIDASVPAGIFLPDEANAKTVLRAEALLREGAVAPALLQLEITNILQVAHRRKRIDGQQLRKVMEAFDALPITIQPALTAQMRGEVLRLAQVHNLSAYDGAYLELAARLDLPLASHDQALLRAAKAEGVKSPWQL